MFAQKYGYLDDVELEQIKVGLHKEVIDEINKFSSRTEAREFAVMIGAVDKKTGKVAIGRSNNQITREQLHPTTVEYLESKTGGKIGEKTNLCGNILGSCAEVNAADKLIRQGANPADIDFTDALRPARVWREEALPPGAIIKRCKNCSATWPF